MSLLKIGVGLLITIPIVRRSKFKTLSIPVTLLTGMTADYFFGNESCDFTKAAAIGGIIGNIENIANALDVRELSQN